MIGLLLGVPALLLLAFALIWWRLGGISGDMRLHRLAPDVWIYRGFFSNSAVFVLPRSVVVVDTQTTPEAGAQLRERIAEITDKPVTHVINTHYHGDHVGGNAAFPEAVVIAPALTARFVHERDQERVEYCQTFGLTLQHVPSVRPPDQTFEGRLELNIDGETLVLAQLGRVETPDAAVVVWPARRAVAAGDGVATDQYPWLGVPFLDEGLQDDGQWMGQLKAIRELRPRVLIPGHGAPLVGEGRIRRRLDLLLRLLSELMETVRAEIQRGTPFSELVERVDAALAPYRRRRDLAERVVSQRFAIYRAYNSIHPERRGRGWWEDLRPSVIRPASPRAGEPETPEGAMRAFHEGRAEPGRELLRRYTEAHPGDARSWALRGYVELELAFGTRPIVDGTEWMREADASIARALALAPAEPLGLLCRGAIDIWGALVTSQSMARPLAVLEQALLDSALGDQRVPRGEGLTRRQRQIGLLFLAKAHQAAGRDAECAAAFRRLLPAVVRPLAPLLVPRMRSLP